jgi:predicted Zn-dependent protease
MRAHTGDGAFAWRLVAIRYSPDRIYRFLFMSRPRTTASLLADFRRATHSFRALSAAEAAAAQPLRVRVRVVRDDETIDDLARRMPFDNHQVQRFLALNGMNPGDRLVPGQHVKIIAN